ncbi:MAG TPA: hypothetical protein VN259_09090 [Xanthomonadales bacterium]|nr:hypothetical protein [Xanthomonadales bacterium]
MSDLRFNELADRFKVLLLDERSRLGAAMIACGGCFWRNGSGGIAIAHNGIFLDLNARQTGQVRAVLPIASAHDAARLASDAVPPHLRNLLRLPLDAQVGGATQNQEDERERDRCH